MPKRFQPVTVQPKMGGALVTALSSDEAGLYNYTVKRDWRRVLDSESRREGHDYFWPNTAGAFSTNPGDQPFPNNKTLTTLLRAYWSEELGGELSPGGSYNPSPSVTITTAIGQRYYWVKGAHDTGLNNNGIVITSTGYFVAGASSVIVSGTLLSTLTFSLKTTSWFVNCTMPNDSNGHPTAHMFVVGEHVHLATDLSAYTGDYVVDSVTKTTLKLTASTVMASEPTTHTLISIEPINMIHLARRPNGQTAVIVGTKPRLFRFFALDDGAYFEGNGTSSAYFQESPYPNTPYFNDSPGEWIIIGNGYSMAGNRWESVEINGWSVFNNGVDLPCTYRVEDFEAVPIYEMREQGIAAVGTIAEFNGILMVGDVTEISSQALLDLFLPIGQISAGDNLASQSVNTVTTQSAIFDSDDVGRWIVYASGTMHKITAYTSATQVTVDGTGETITNSKFAMATKAHQDGAFFSGSITATYNHTTSVATLSSAPAHTTSAGDVFRFSNGFSSIVTVVTDTTHFTLTAADDPGVDFSTGMPFWVSNTAAHSVESDAPLFTEDMVGRLLTWGTGDVRTILEFIDSTQVLVDSDMAVGSNFAGVENPETYGRYTQTQFTSRIQYRVAWSSVGEPRRWAPAIPVIIQAGSNQFTLVYPAKSFESGQEITIIGAGPLGGNLTATILFITANQFGILDVPADTTVTSGLMQQSASIGTIVGAEDIEDDGSGVLKMLVLQGSLIIYKDTSIFIVNYLGSPAQPFEFIRRQIDQGRSLYYRYTLAHVESDGTSFHVYAGKDHFFRFDLATQRPVISESAENCKNLFFDQATITNKNLIFSASNSVTNEIVFAWPSNTSDAALLFDATKGTFSTTSAVFTAASTPKRPETGTSVGETVDWFLMANAAGVVLLYGKCNEPVASWAGVKVITYRREANPFSATKGDYDSIRRGGMSDFGDSNDEKDIESYVPILASGSPEAILLISLYGARNTAEGPTLLTGFPYTMASPATKNAVPCYFRQNYFMDQIKVTGHDNPVQIARTIWSVSALKSNSFIRRP